MELGCCKDGCTDNCTICVTTELLDISVRSKNSTMKSQVIRNIDALCFCKVPNNMTVTIVTTIIRCAGTIKRTIHQLREIVNRIATYIDDYINTFRNVQFVCSFREIKDENIFRSIKSSRSLSFYFQPSAATLLAQDRIGVCLCKAVSAICTGYHSCFSISKAHCDSFNDVICIGAETIC